MADAFCSARVSNVTAAEARFVRHDKFCRNKLKKSYDDESRLFARLVNTHADNKNKKWEWRKERIEAERFLFF